MRSRRCVCPVLGDLAVGSGTRDSAAWASSVRTGGFGSWVWELCISPLIHQVFTHVELYFDRVSPSPGERPFKCSECGKAFNQKGALQTHMIKHTGEKPHACAFCPAAFSQKGNLQSHVQRVHSEVNVALGSVLLLGAVAGSAVHAGARGFEMQIYGLCRADFVSNKKQTRVSL